MADLRWIVYHHTNTGDARPTVRSIAEYQTGPTSHLDFPAIAYTVFVDPDGTAYLCHDLDVVTWGQGDGSPWSRRGVGGNNWRGLAVAFAGEHPTAAQLVKLKLVGDEIDRRLDRRLLRLGHRDVSIGDDGQPLTECPGSKWPEWRAEVGG